jgi:N-acetyl-alpha-D-muramate 1-phosphate uridylyltransferase
MMTETKNGMLPVAILAGGLATRLKPLTERVPKSLVVVAGEPFIAHQLRLLKKNGFECAMLCVGHLGEMIEEVIGNGNVFGLNVEYSYDGSELAGTAGAVRSALSRLGPSFFVLYGDSYLPCDYRAVQQAFESAGKSGLMTVFRNDGQWDTSNVEFEAGRILAYSKKNRTPRMRYIDYGLGIFRAGTFSQIQAKDLADVYEGLLKTGQLAAFEVHERFYEIGSPAGLEETSRYLSAQTSGDEALNEQVLTRQGDSRQ